MWNLGIGVRVLLGTGNNLSPKFGSLQPLSDHFKFCCHLLAKITDTCTFSYPTSMLWICCVECDCVCVCVCNLYQIFAHVPYDCGSVLFQHHCDTLCTSVLWYHVFLLQWAIWPAFVAEWLTHSAAMCSRAWRAQWPGFDSAWVRSSTKELFVMIPMHMMNREIIPGR